MYEFPPTPWQIHGLAFSVTTVSWLIAVIVFLVALVASRSGSARLCGFWAFAGTVAAMLVLTRYGKAASLWAPPYPVDDVLRLTLAAICAIGLGIALWANSKKAESGGFAAMAGTALAGLFFVLPALLPPTVSHPSTARRTQCKNNLKQIGLAFHNYSDAQRYFPPAKISKPSKSWRVNLLPFMYEQELYGEYDESSAWDSKANHPLTMKRVSALMCPQRPKRTQQNDQGQYFTSYTVPVGPQTIFDGSQQVGFRDITDGSSNTLMVVESCGTKIVWSEPRDSLLSEVDLGVNAGSSSLDQSNSLLSSYHGGGVQVLLADGSVRFMSKDIAPKMLEALISKSGGESIGHDW